MKAAATLALLGLAQASHCNINEITYTSKDCSGTGTSKSYILMAPIGECSTDKTISVFIKECTATNLKYDYFMSNKFCSGTATIKDISLKVGKCNVGTSKSTKYVMPDGAAITAVAWASVAIAMLAAHV